MTIVFRIAFLSGTVRHHAFRIPSFHAYAINMQVFCKVNLPIIARPVFQGRVRTENSVCSWLNQWTSQNHWLAAIRLRGCGRSGF